LTRLKQICNHPSHYSGDGKFAPEDSAKFLRLQELCEPIAASGEKVLVFTQFREMCGPLAALLAGSFGRAGLVFHGGLSVRRRMETVAEFQRQGGPPFMVVSLKAGGTGLNLTAAAHVVHFDRWWNPAVENQATDRAYRIGQHKNVLVHKFVCRGTLEERIDALIRGKQGLADNILEIDGEQSLTELGTEELLRVVALDLRAAVEEDAWSTRSSRTTTSTAIRSRTGRRVRRSTSSAGSSPAARWARCGAGSSTSVGAPVAPSADRRTCVPERWST
jgi:SNF2 family DNA or RNA helicase